MIPNAIRAFISDFHQASVNNFITVGGGSINEAYKYSLNDTSYFVKFNNQIEGIIEKEVEALNAIDNLNCIATPQIICFKKLNGYEILILEFINSGIKSHQSWENFGRQLANMHKEPAPFYGWEENNFIGALEQSNKPQDNFRDFFIHQRLSPQLGLAKKKNLLSRNELKLFDKLFLNLPSILPDTKPSLVHGDLWSGNFIIGENDRPYLIDPAVHYSFREIDLAFTHLFGGFDSTFYDSYQNQYRLEPNFNERIDLYNLYPLLVHLNLFGTGYYHSVISSLKKYV
ncbi:fructosamine kinase family protein [Marivirga arenosa]|uniref:Fructosamine kinase family protein n=1 Tax=Marivirga arenosa TaxID=3059076 RepID=A0AA51N505_9BACT|nr:fructosamine kinase family protein [Marivirga sp. ABR2-2]WMN06416.1 fructosamine kinase family protein [Marivirga sp. ABR2-2]